jgi:hypothetical protein
MQYKHIFISIQYQYEYYGVSLSSIPCACRLSHDVSAHIDFLCDKTTILTGTV